jgi:hypothetical protein
LATVSKNFKVRRGIEISGSTSGVATIVPPAAAGTPTLTLPTTTGFLDLNPLTTTGDIGYATNTATPATVGRLAVGTGFQVLGVAAGIPAWTTLTLENLPGAFVKKSVKAATTANIATLAGGAPNTLDGVSLALNDRILVKDQSTGSQNGLYYVTTLGTGANGTWARSLDADTIDDIASAMVAVDSGTVNGGLTYDNDLKTTDTLGTTSVVWNRIVDAAYSVNLGTTAVPLNRASGALTLAGITLTQPTIADFTNATHTHAAAASGGLLTTLGTVTTGVWNAGAVTSSGTITGPAATTALASLRLPHGVAPTSPTNGDMWTTTAGVYARINGATVGPLGAGGGGFTVQDAPPTVTTGGAWFESDTGRAYVGYDGFWVEIGAGQVGPQGPAGATGGAGPAGQSTVPYVRSGALTVAAGEVRYRFPTAVTILGVSMACNTAPTGASIICDVNKNGTTIFTTQGNRPTIAASAFNTASEVTNMDVTAFAAGDYLTVDIDQVGSTIAGQNLTVLVRYI